MAPDERFKGALDVFVDGVQKILDDVYSRYHRVGAPPKVYGDIGRTKAKIYSLRTVNGIAERINLSEIEIATGKIMLPNDKKKVSRGNIFNPDRGLKNIASDGRPAFVK